jgi:hypothetical protein
MPTARAKRSPPDSPPGLTPRADAGQVLAAVEDWLGTLELDELGSARAALARTLAMKLDQVLHVDSGQAAMAVPGISKELREVLDAIEEASDDSTEFVGNLFTAVGDSAQS